MGEVSEQVLADFGATLRRLRLQRGMSLGRLAAVVYYSRSHLSRIEHGLKRPSEALARLCDAALDAGGVLRHHPAVSPSDGEAPAPALEPFGSTPWVLRLAADGSGSWETQGLVHPLQVGSAPLAEQWTMFGALRSLGRTARPSVVLPLASAFFSVVRSAVAASVGRTRRDQMIVGARLAEYLGWMWQEAGNDDAALTWTDWAVAIAREADDREMSEYAAARRALVALYRRDAAQVVALTERAAATASPRVRWLSALREAQGHALAGDAARCLAALDRARTLADTSTPHSGEPTVLGPATASDRLAAVTGWCLYDLGRPAEAVPELRRAITTMTPGTREHSRFGVRLALAYAASGDLRRGCDLMTQLLDAVVQVDSATIRSDLRVFSRMIERHHRDPEAAALRQRLAIALAPARAHLGRRRSGPSAGPGVGRKAERSFSSYASRARLTGCDGAAGPGHAAGRPAAVAERGDPRRRGRPLREPGVRRRVDGCHRRGRWGDRARALPPLQGQGGDARRRALPGERKPAERGPGPGRPARRRPGGGAGRAGRLPRRLRARQPGRDRPAPARA